MVVLGGGWPFRAALAALACWALLSPAGPARADGGSRELHGVAAARSGASALFSGATLATLTDPRLSSLTVAPAPAGPGPLAGAEERERIYERCRGLAVVLTHRAGYTPDERDPSELQALVRDIYLRLRPEWPDGLPAYPIARPAGHPVTGFLQAHVLEASPTEIAHHFQVMAERFGKTPPPVVESPRLILRLVARRPGAVAVLRVDELPGARAWPPEVRIAGVLGPEEAGGRCPLARLRTVLHGEGGAVPGLLGAWSGEGPAPSLSAALPLLSRGSATAERAIPGSGARVP